MNKRESVFPGTLWDKERGAEGPLRPSPSTSRLQTQLRRADLSSWKGELGSAGQVGQGKVAGSAQRAGRRAFCKESCAELGRAGGRAGEMSWGEGPGEARDRNEGTGGARPLPRRGGPQHGPCVFRACCREKWGEELDGEDGGPQGGARCRCRRVSSGQAFHPDVPQFPPSC